MYALVLILVAILICLFLKKVTKQTFIILFLALVITSLFVFPMDRLIRHNLPIELTLTALRTDAEIWLNDLSVDGRQSEINEFTEGTWIKAPGNVIGWRSYDLPEAVTQSVSFNVPVGFRGELEFSSNIWRGTVEISYDDTNFVAETNSNTQDLSNTVDVKVDLYSTPNFAKYVIYSNAFCLLMFSLLVCIFVKIDLKKFAEFVKKNDMLIICSFIGVGYCEFLILNTNEPYLAFDDFLQLGISYPTFTIGEYFNNVLHEDSTPPLYGLIAHIWLIISPYGIGWLRLLSEIATSIGIVITSMAAYKLGNKTTGIFTALFAITSTSLILFAGYTFRTYGFYFLFSSLTILLYILKTKSVASKKLTILYTISIILTSYSHYFGALLCGVLFICDLFLYVKRRYSAKFIIPYIVTGIAYLPWFIPMIIVTRQMMEGFWPPIPTPKSLWKLFEFMTNNSFIEKEIFIIAILIILYTTFKAIKEKRYDYSNQYIYIVFLCIITLIPAIIYIYPNYIDPNWSLFITRYFMCMLPVYFILLGFGLERIFNYSFELRPSEFLGRYLIATCLLIFVPLTFYSIKYYTEYLPQNTELHEDVVENILALPDVHEDGVAVITTVPNNGIRGFNYFFTENESKEGILFYESDEMLSEEIDNISKIYNYTFYGPTSSEFNDLMESSSFSKTSESSNGWYVIYERN